MRRHVGVKRTRSSDGPAVIQGMFAQEPATIEDVRFGLTVRKRVRLAPPLPLTVATAAAQFWQARGVRFQEVSASRLIGQRGSLWWNPVTFDMSKLRSELRVTVDNEIGAIECVLHVNTLLQSITAMNRQYWIEEMETFEAVLVRNDDRASEWEEFRRDAKKASTSWVVGIAVVVGTATIIRGLAGPFLEWLAGVFGR